MRKELWVLGLAVGLVFSDFLITILFWSLEANPIVIELGQLSFGVIKIAIIIVMPIIWIQFKAKESVIGWVIMGVLIVFHGIVLIGNLTVILL